MNIYNCYLFQARPWYGIAIDLDFPGKLRGKNKIFYLYDFTPTGTASSVAFTPLQGLEIVNPQAAEKKVDEANAKYFSTSASFIKVQTPIVPSMGPPRKINKWIYIQKLFINFHFVTGVERAWLAVTRLGAISKMDISTLQYFTFALKSKANTKMLH